jgi:amino acid adenylation domain-containing protein
MDVLNVSASCEPALPCQEKSESKPYSLDLPLLTAAERLTLLVEWNDTQASYPKDLCIHQLIEAQVERSPEAIAVVCEEQQLTYRQLCERANCLAHYLRVLGVGPEVLVGICTQRSLEMVVGLLGILKAGGAYLPLDPAYPFERLAFMLEDAQVPVLLTTEHLVEKLPTTWAQVISLDSDWELIAQHSCENPTQNTTSDNLAYVIYTSGSTGKPKGVEIQHRGLVNLVTWHQRLYNVTPQDRATQLAGPAFDASVWELWPYLAAGASIHILSAETCSVSPSKLWEWLTESAITICFLPTPLAQTMLAQWPQGLALRALLTGGDKLHRVPQKALPFCLVNHYGPTENTVVTTWAPVAAGIKTDAPPPIGRPIANTQIYLLDAKNQLVPIGMPGELHIGGDSLARGYRNRPELTNEKFIPNPFSNSPGDRLYKTGDLARYLSDGNIEFLGRIDDQVKIRGFRIELGEIETVLTQHPCVQQAVVLARSDEAGDKRLVAYIVTEQKSTLALDELNRFLEGQLPDYMIPKAFVMLEALPITANGKVNRNALPSPAQRPLAAEEDVSPQTEVEQNIAAVWQEVLNVEKLGIHDNFFDLGAHSIHIGQVNGKLKALLNRDISMIEMFKYPTISSLTKYLNQSQVQATSYKQIHARAQKKRDALHRKSGKNNDD